MRTTQATIGLSNHTHGWNGGAAISVPSGSRAYEPSCTRDEDELTQRLRKLRAVCCGVDGAVGLLERMVGWIAGWLAGMRQRFMTTKDHIDATKSLQHGTNKH